MTVSVWLQLGDTYAAGGNGGGSLMAKRRQWTGAHERKGWRRQAWHPVTSLVPDSCGVTRVRNEQRMTSWGRLMMQSL
jgi:hypothetical protein